jgi:hypothetical protein
LSIGHHPGNEKRLNKINFIFFCFFWQPEQHTAVWKHVNVNFFFSSASRNIHIQKISGFFFLHHTGGQFLLFDKENIKIRNVFS